MTELARERLITVGEDEAEVAHEALLREWPRLRGWLEEDAEGRRLHRHLTHAARDWNAGGRDASELYRGSRLAAALEWADAHGDELNDVEREFLDASRAAAELEAESRAAGEPPVAGAAGRSGGAARRGGRRRRRRRLAARRGA